ncbi:probable serine/threonine-protein kinase PIX13 [Rhodamnia argentea]|uniref:non-specific serine/threonine protein kinase n=1 Tax=Rhodamnia argentea TaxID=178133 RepID=A0A8B8NXT3_9MYRT|nr:probable serine/threonine-protein kinase PIX13 [Rhodamnia argentea]
MGNCCWGDSSADGDATYSSNTARKRPPHLPVPDALKSNYDRHKQDALPRKRAANGASNGSQNGAPENGRENEKKTPSSSAAGAQEALLPNLKMFTFAELRSATRNFRPDTVLGEGGFGRVFKGWVDEGTYKPSRVGVGIPVAVKKSSPDSPQGLQEWQAEVKFLGKYSHPNLVRLIGYCWEDNQFLLVYEYMQKRSLQNHLFEKGGDPLPWDVRLKIAIGAARGLAFLHTSEKSVIYRDFKASNILLDGEFNAKLSDFGLAKLGPTDGNSHVSTRIMGTYGYAAPEYMATGHLYINSDVYGFGVVLLELLTGLQAMDSKRPSSQHNLVEWAKPSLSEKRRLKKIVDPRLDNEYPSKAAAQVAELILKCLEGDPRKRPSMEHVLATLELVNAIKLKPREVRPRSEQLAARHGDHRSPSHHHHHHHHHRSPRHHREGQEGGPSSVRSP